MPGEITPKHNGEDFHWEESLAEDKRREFVSDMFQRATERLMEEGQDERRINRELQSALAEMQIKAEHDPFLTQLLNRIGFNEVLNKFRKKGASGTLLLLDIDKFKIINDQFGHGIGDKALKTAANYVKENSRPTDVVCRWGGEEIAVFYPGATAEEVLQKFHKQGSDKSVMEVPFDFENPELRPDNLITFSGGITELGLEEDLDEAMKRADSGLYFVKAHGRNQLVIAGPDAREERAAA